jgi:hypothetical protein
MSQKVEKAAFAAFSGIKHHKPRVSTGLYGDQELNSLITGAAFFSFRSTHCNKRAYRSRAQT